MSRLLRFYVRCGFLLAAVLLLGGSSLAQNTSNPPVRRAERITPGGNRGLPTPGGVSTTSTDSVLNDDARTNTRLPKRSSVIDRDSDKGGDYSDAMLPNTMDGLNDKRQLGVGDRLSFKVVEDEGMPRSLVITDSNEVDVPYIGRVAVANKTCKQFAFYIKKLLEKEYYFQATVIVGLDSAGNSARAMSRGRIYVMGAVRGPGPQDIPVDEVYTVAKAILRAGGFGPYANKRKVKLVRGGKDQGSAKPIIIDCAEILDKGHWDKDVEVSPDDVITIPERIINLF